MAVDFFRLTNKKSLSTTCNGARDMAWGGAGSPASGSGSGFCQTLFTIHTFSGFLHRRIELVFSVVAVDASGLA